MDDRMDGLTHSQLLEGLKEKSQIEDNGKKEGVGARSLIRSTRRVEGRAGIRLERGTNYLVIRSCIQNQPQSD
jgi:hypothetical protein